MARQQVRVLTHHDVGMWLDSGEWPIGRVPNESPNQWDVMSLSNEEELEYWVDYGATSLGLTEAEIERSTVVGMYQERADRGRSSQSNDVDCCVICQENFELPEKIRTLRCFHFYHVQCIDKWLQSSTTCPMCKVSVIG
mmetsp:Transcript_18107/g.28345  ORF Transcript_18107/g.28345 Transcript_18107/m.28345 type:complete len:139 (-) Transcript_18107:42-458(-)